MRRPGEALGTVAGWVVAPVFAALSVARRARPVHPSGKLYEAHVEREVEEGPYADLAEELRGPALVRFSRAFFRSRGRRPDLFGCAVRFLADSPARPDVHPGDQDLLFTTVRSVVTIPLATLTTNRRDFLANDYYGVSPFELRGRGLRGKFYLRLVPDRTLTTGEDAEARLADAVRRGNASLHLEVARAPRGPYERIARVHLAREATIDDARIRFHPAVSGRGIRARGPMQRFRFASYSVAHALRPSRSTRRV